MSLQVGDVIVAHEIYGTDVKCPVHCLVLRAGEERHSTNTPAVYVRILDGDHANGQCKVECSQAEAADPDSWPPELCRRLALYRLTGEVA